MDSRNTDRRLFRTTLEHAATLQMIDAYGSLDKYIFTPILKRFRVPPKEQQYLMSFYLNGLIAIINRWLLDDCRDSVEYIAAVMQRCVSHGLTID